MKTFRSLFFVFSHLTHTATSNQETSLLCLYLALIFSVLSPLNEAICARIGAYPGYCNWLPSDWTPTVLLERMSHPLHPAIRSRFGLCSPPAEMKENITFGHVRLLVLVSKAWTFIFICLGIHMSCTFYFISFPPYSVPTLTSPFKLLSIQFIFSITIITHRVGSTEFEWHIYWIYISRQI